MLNPDCIQGMDFVDKFLEDYQKIESLGFKRSDVLKMLGSQDYVQDFAETPDFFVSAPKLPKGYKWADGEKYTRKRAGKKDFGETYVLLIIENDIYIKGFYVGWEYYVKDTEAEYGVAYYDVPKDLRNKICVIKNWKTMKPQYVLWKLDKVTPFFENSLTNFYSQNSGNLSMQDGPALDEIEEILRKREAIANEKCLPLLQD